MVKIAIIASLITLAAALPQQGANPSGTESFSLQAPTGTGFPGPQPTGGFGGHGGEGGNGHFSAGAFPSGAVPTGGFGGGHGPHGHPSGTGFHGHGHPSGTGFPGPKPTGSFGQEGGAPGGPMQSADAPQP